MRAEIVSIGTELLLGEIVDTNAAHIAKSLKEIGVDVYFKTTVGDNLERIRECIDHALNRSDVVVTTGGLGPTVDDMTREGIALATGSPLEFQQELLDQIADRFRRFGAQMSKNNRRQAFVPKGAIAIENPVGTAPIFIHESSRGIVIVLPGVPREMKHLLAHDVIPWLQAHLGEPVTIQSLTLRTAGIGESQIDDKIGDLMTLTNPTVGLAAHTGQTDIRITAKASSTEDALALIKPVETTIRERLDRWIYGTGDELLEAALIRTLGDDPVRLVVAETGTDGVLAERLRAVKSDSVEITAVPLTNGNDLENSAQSIRTENDADYSLLIRLSDSEDESHGTIIAVSGQSNTMSRSYEWNRAQRTDAHIWASNHVLSLLRHMLLDS